MPPFPHPGMHGLTGRDQGGTHSHLTLSSPCLWTLEGLEPRPQFLDVFKTTVGWGGGHDLVGCQISASTSKKEKSTSSVKGQ